MQLLVLQPLALALLDHATSDRRFSVGRAMARPLTNPLTVGSLLGLLLALTGFPLPAVVRDPLELVGGMAVPSMLIAYGISLRLGPRPGHGTSAAEVGLISVLKLVVQPLTAYLVARFVLGAGRHRPAGGDRARGPADGPEHLRARHALRPRRGARP